MTASASGLDAGLLRAGPSMRTPLHQALLIRSPPTSLDTQFRVIQTACSGRATSSAYVSVISRSTMPWMRTRQSSGAIAGGAEGGVDPVEAGCSTSATA